MFLKTPFCCAGTAGRIQASNKASLPASELVRSYKVDRRARGLVTSPVTMHASSFAVQRAAGSGAEEPAGSSWQEGARRKVGVSERPRAPTPRLGTLAAGSLPGTTLAKNRVPNSGSP